MDNSEFKTHKFTNGTCVLCDRKEWAVREYGGTCVLAKINVSEIAPDSDGEAEKSQTVPTYSKCSNCGKLAYDESTHRCTDQECDATFGFNCFGCLDQDIVVRLDPDIAWSGTQVHCPKCHSTMSVMSGPEKGTAVVKLVVSRRYDYEFTKLPYTFKSKARGGGPVT